MYCKFFSTSTPSSLSTCFLMESLISGSPGSKISEPSTSTGRFGRRDFALFSYCLQYSSSSSRKTFTDGGVASSRSFSSSSSKALVLAYSGGPLSYFVSKFPFPKGSLKNAFIWDLRSTSKPFELCSSVEV